MKKLTIIALIFSLFFTCKVLSQVNVSTVRVFLNSQTTINSWDLIDFGTTVNNSLVVNFRLTKPSNQVVGDGTVRIMFRSSSGVSAY